jgi:hypothetical protein
VSQKQQQQQHRQQHRALENLNWIAGVVRGFFWFREQN